MKTFALLLAATLASAFPEPTPVAFCDEFGSKCHQPASRYCSAQLTTTTTVTSTGEPTTVTAFPSDYPCLNPPNAKTKRERDPTLKQQIQNTIVQRATPAGGRVPKCLRKVIHSGGDEALASACACYGIYPSTSVVHEDAPGPTETVYANSFLMQANKDEQSYAHQNTYDGSEYFAQFDTTLDNAVLFSINDQCSLVGLGGRLAYADPEASNSDVSWYFADNLPEFRSLALISCQIGGHSLDTLSCTEHYKTYNVHNAAIDNVWDLTSDPMEVPFDISVTPVLASAAD